VIEPATAGATSTPSPSKPQAKSHRAARPALPVRVQIPSIGVDAHLVSLGLDATGALEAPKSFTGAGWWSGGARPGETGPAVIAGHVDSKTGPAVFFRLRDLHRGDAIVVTRRDGSRVRFTVQRSASYSKTRFPTKAVYGPTASPALRLITCSGTFDRSTGHYLDNTVVYAGGAT
jgi:sortase (surface protein transpeptidase)